MLHGDARAIDLEGPYDGVITSPPYPGLIDYHEQHRYAYELLGVDERRDLELGRPARGTGRAAIEEYVEGVARVLANARSSLTLGGRMCIVVNDRRELYPEICGGRGYTSSTVTSGTSTAARGDGPASTSSRFSSPQRPERGSMSMPAASGVQRPEAGAGPAVASRYWLLLVLSGCLSIWFLRRPQQVWHPYVWARRASSCATSSMEVGSAPCGPSRGT